MLTMVDTQPERIAEARSSLPTRAEVRDHLIRVLDAWGVTWAWQGPADAVDTWLQDTGPADLDLWWRPGSGPSAPDTQDVVRQLCQQLRATPVVDARDPARLRHTSVVVRTRSGLAVIDLTHGTLQVGPVILLPAARVTTVRAPAPRLSGPAGVADLLLRPLLRGKVPPAARIAQARATWWQAAAGDRREALALWAESLGMAIVEDLRDILAGGDVPPGLVTRVRRRLVRATLAPRALPSSWRARRTIRPAGRRASPLGLRGNGVVVALVGTDGCGKSTVAAQVGQRLGADGFIATSAYFGMARGNLPGVALARQLLRVADSSVPAAPASRARDAEPRSAAALAGATAGRPDRSTLDRPLLRRAAAWYYAAEYVWRYQRMVAPARRRGAVVLVDRYVYDLRDSPWPGSWASRVAEAVVPAPDILVLPDAPDGVIHARKPERPAVEQAAIQEGYRRLMAQRPARLGHVVVDTSGQTADPVAGLELAVISAAHGRTRESRSGAGADTR